MADSYSYLPKQNPSLRRRPHPSTGKPEECDLNNDDDNNVTGKNRKQTSPIRTFAKFVLFLLLLLAAILAAANPFFPNFFEEINFFLHHLAKTADWMLLKRRQRPNDKILYFLHLSKCGGTSIMEAAQASGLSVPIRNGLTQRDWRCCGGDDSMEAQANFAKNSPFDFVANENDMYEAMDTEHYSYIVTLRNSRKRYYSMWAQWQKDPIMTVQLGAMDFPTWTASFGEDNFMFRKICGTKCRGIPKFQIPREHFQPTLERLEKFDSILFLETFQQDYAEFAKKHGWSAPEQKKRISSHSILSTGETVKESDGEKDWNFHMSALDDALYEYAQRIVSGSKPFGQFTERTQKNVEDYFAKK